MTRAYKVRGLELKMTKRVTTNEEKAHNLIELFHLLDETRRYSFHTVGDVCKALEAAGLLRAYDTALPQMWVDKVMLAQGQSVPVIYPPGHVVWCYDRLRFGGAPFAITPDGEKLLSRLPQHLSLSAVGTGESEDES